MKGVQCYELFRGIALKIHTFSFFSFSIYIKYEGNHWKIKHALCFSKKESLEVLYIKDYELDRNV